MQVLNSIRKHPKKNKYFPMHILFTTIYLLKEHKLNHRNYSEQKLNMGNVVKAKEHHMSMHAKFQYLNIYVFL
jgi:hypothetical protein